MEQGRFAPREILGNLCLETVLVFTTGSPPPPAGRCYCHLVGESRDAAQNPTVQRTVPTTDNDPAQTSLVLRLRNPGHVVLNSLKVKGRNKM